MRVQRAALVMLLATGLAACSDDVATTEPQLAMQPQMSSHRTIPLVEDVTGALTGGTFAGTVQITEFALENGELVVSGVANGVATIGGVATNIVNQAFTTSADLTRGDAGKCDILFLDLGPLFLDVLGLEVDLAEVILDINAVPGAGNLLGNLLCAVVNLLNNPLANIQGLLNILDRINDLLG